MHGLRLVNPSWERKDRRLAFHGIVSEQRMRCQILFALFVNCRCPVTYDTSKLYIASLGYPYQCDSLAIESLQCLSSTNDRKVGPCCKVDNKINSPNDGERYIKTRCTNFSTRKLQLNKQLGVMKMLCSANINSRRISHAVIKCKWE